MILEGDRQIRLEMGGEGFEVDSEGASISPYHLLAGSLASCIGLVAQPWAEGAAIDLQALVIGVAWEHVDEDGRVSSMDVELRWPGLPASRVPAVERIVRACPVHDTLVSGVEIESRVLLSRE